MQGAAGSQTVVPQRHCDAVSGRQTAQLGLLRRFARCADSDVLLDEIERVMGERLLGAIKNRLRDIAAGVPATPALQVKGDDLQRPRDLVGEDVGGGLLETGFRGFPLLPPFGWIAGAVMEAGQDHISSPRLDRIEEVAQVRFLSSMTNTGQCYVSCNKKSSGVLFHATRVAGLMARAIAVPSRARAAIISSGLR